MNTVTISRRRFAQMLGVGAACAVVRPSLTLAKQASASAKSATTSNVVRISSNENPYGPSSEALKAMSNAFDLSCRYPDEHAGPLIEGLAKINGVSTNQILLGDGSGEILKLCAETFTGPGGNAASGTMGRGALIVGDPTFEAILNHAGIHGAEVVKVPLTQTYGHDLPKMTAAANEGLIYVCNPNNPTASITARNEVRDFVGKVPRQTMILIDEAYYHYADSPDYESAIPLVKDYPNLIVARTFSKIYGMAGLRCGYCIAQPQVIERLRPHQPWDSLNIMALAAAHASLGDANQVSNGRRLNNETKRFLEAELQGIGYRLIPSQANFVMIDLKRPVVPLIQALKKLNVEVGRLFPAMPNHMRVTLGTKTEMETFVSAFRQVMA